MKKYKIFSFCNGFSKCESCMFVDKKYTEQYDCINCGSSKGQEKYLPSGALNLVILIETLYPKLNAFIKNNNSKDIKNKESVSHLAIIIFFCSLLEVLLGNFLHECMVKMQIPQVVQEKIFNDNLSIKKRLCELFQVLTGIKWKDAIKYVNKKSSVDYSIIDKFCKRITKARNKFIHEGEIFEIEDDDPEKCYNYIKPIVTLFIDLHNQYISNNNYKP